MHNFIFKILFNTFYAEYSFPLGQPSRGGVVTNPNRKSDVSLCRQTTGFDIGRNTNDANNDFQRVFSERNRYKRLIYISPKNQVFRKHGPHPGRRFETSKGRARGIIAVRVIRKTFATRRPVDTFG